MIATDDRISDIIECTKRLGLWNRPIEQLPQKNDEKCCRAIDALRLKDLGIEYGEAEQLATEYAVWMRGAERFICAYCGKDIPPWKGARHIDHIFPLSAGGSHRPSNLVPSCRKCNYRKKAKTTFKLPHVAPHLTVEAWGGLRLKQKRTRPVKEKPDPNWDQEWFESWCKAND